MYYLFQTHYSKKRMIWIRWRLKHSVRTRREKQSSASCAMLKNRNLTLNNKERPLRAKLLVLRGVRSILEYLIFSTICHDFYSHFLKIISIHVIQVQIIRIITYTTVVWNTLVSLNLPHLFEHTTLVWTYHIYLNSPQLFPPWK